MITSSENNLTVAKVECELAQLHDDFLKSRKIIIGQRKATMGQIAGQKSIFGTVGLPNVATADSLKTLDEQLAKIKAENSRRQRNLTALLRVLHDENELAAEAAQKTILLGPPFDAE